MRSRILISLCLLTISLGVGRMRANGTDTRLLAQPAVSATHVAFIYAGDLWSAHLDGADVRRLTTSEGPVSNPAFSPDGRTLAFSAQYNGNTDVYVVGVEGGAPTRLTWHPGAGPGAGLHARRPQRRLHVASRGLHRRATRSCSRCPWPAASKRRCRSRTRRARRYSPDGRRIAYDPLAPAFLQWKHYRGGQVSTVMHLRRAVARDREDRAAGVAGQRRRSGLGRARRSIFRSDRDGEFNVYAYDSKVEAGPAGHPSRRLPGPEHRRRRRPRRLRAGRLSAPARSGERPGEEADVRGSVRSARNARALRARRRSGSATASLSPSGARAVFEFRGDIVTVPAEKGRRPQPDADHRRPRADAGLVARRHAHRVLLRQERRVPARRRAAGRQRRAASLSRSRATDSTRTRSGRPTARRSPTPTTRSRSTGSICKTGRVEEDRVAGNLHARRRSCAARGRRTRNGSPTRSAPGRW